MEARVGEAHAGDAGADGSERSVVLQDPIGPGDVGCVEEVFEGPGQGPGTVGTTRGAFGHVAGHPDIGRSLPAGGDGGGHGDAAGSGLSAGGHQLPE